MNLFFDSIIFINAVFHAESISEARIAIGINLTSKEVGPSSHIFYYDQNAVSNLIIARAVRGLWKC